MAKTILLVEDSRDDERLFMRVMKQSGLTNPVMVVRDGSEALAYLKGEEEFADREKFPQPEILLLDLKLPKASGFQVLQWIKSQPDLHDMLVVVLSHFGATKEISRAYALGAHSFLTKPITQADLLSLTKHYNRHWETVSGTKGSFQ